MDALGARIVCIPYTDRELFRKARPEVRKVGGTIVVVAKVLTLRVSALYEQGPLQLQLGQPPVANQFQGQVSAYVQLQLATCQAVDPMCKATPTDVRSLGRSINEDALAVAESLVTSKQLKRYRADGSVLQVEADDVAVLGTDPQALHGFF